MLIFFSILLLTLLPFAYNFDGATVGWTMFMTDFAWWWHNDAIPLVTNPDAYASTVNSPWFGQGRITH